MCSLLFSNVMLCVGNFLPTYQGVIKLVHVVKEIKEIRLRELSLNDAKEEIYRYLLPNPDSYPYEIANELWLELSRVHEALIELRKAVKAEEVE